MDQAKKKKKKKVTPRKGVAATPASTSAGGGVATRPKAAAAGGAPASLRNGRRDVRQARDQQRTTNQVRPFFDSRPWPLAGSSSSAGPIGAGFNGFTWALTGFDRVCCGFISLYLVLLGITSFFTEFYRYLPFLLGNTVFYWVLTRYIGFTWFYLV